MIIYNSFARKVFLTSDVSYSQIGLIYFPDHLLEVTRTDVDNLPKQFCVGRRSKVKFDDKEIYSQQSKKNFKKITGGVTDSILDILREDDPENVETIDGGPACFGDSGKARMIFTIIHSLCFKSFFFRKQNPLNLTFNCIPIHIILYYFGDLKDVLFLASKSQKRENIVILFYLLWSGFSSHVHLYSGLNLGDINSWSCVNFIHSHEE